MRPMPLLRADVAAKHRNPFPWPPVFAPTAARFPVVDQLNTAEGNHCAVLDNPPELRGSGGV
jgi:hypothetical protein